MPTSAPTTTSVSGVNAKECSKCGKMKKSSKFSCCARGGAWYDNCGDPGDPNFDHTWFEGFQACKSKFIRLRGSCRRVLCNLNAFVPSAVPTTTSVSGVSDKECSKCGNMNKSGKISCCARGGSWYGYCGDPGDSRFGHTWREGIQACKSKFIRLCEPCGMCCVT